MSIRKFLDLSTSHVRYETLQILDLESKDSTTVLVGQCGAMCWTGFADNRPDLPDLQEALAYGKALGVDYVMFDADAEEVEDLPTYESSWRAAEAALRS